MNRFKQMESESIYWLNCANDLNAATRVLYLCASETFPAAEEKEKIGLHGSFSLPIALSRPILLNSAYSLELLFKACLVTQRMSFDYIHNLVELAELAKITYNDSQKCTLRIYSDSATWFGRYPVPKTESAFESNNKNWNSLRKYEKQGGLKVSISDEEKWPTFENYCLIWDIAFNHYIAQDGAK